MTTFWRQQKALTTLTICCKFQNDLYDFWFYTHFFNHFIHVHNPGVRADKPLGSKFWCQQKALTNSTICCKFQKKYLWILIVYTFCNILPHVYSPGEGQTTLCGQNSDVNRKALSLCPFIASFKKCLWSLTLYIFLPVFIHVYSPGAGADNPLGSEILF